MYGYTPNTTQVCKLETIRMRIFGFCVTWSHGMKTKQKENTEIRSSYNLETWRISGFYDFRVSLCAFALNSEDRSSPGLRPHLHKSAEAPGRRQNT